MPILYWKKELEMLLRLLKSFGMKDANAVVDSYPCDAETTKSKQYHLPIMQRNSNRRRILNIVETGPGVNSS